MILLKHWERGIFHIFNSIWKKIINFSIFNKVPVILWLILSHWDHCLQLIVKDLVLHKYNLFIFLKKTLKNLNLFFKKKEREVTIAHFNDMAYWFGPFVCPQRGSVCFIIYLYNVWLIVVFFFEINQAILAWMKHLNSQLWFHGDIEREVAERRLLHRDDGIFLYFFWI